MRNPAALAAKAKLTIPDLERAFRETEEMRFLGGDDYEMALNWIRRAKCSFIKDYEEKYGPWTGPRPKDCSEDLL